MITLIFATNNQHKVQEIQSVLQNTIQIISLKEAGIEKEIPEPFDTLEENATTKSETIYNITQTNCFSEDTGLEIDALQGKPGVKSARYAGENASFDENVNLVLDNLKNEHNRAAQFRTVISLIWNNQNYLFEGICKGTITNEKKGLKGFGYDPIFTPNGSTKTFAEMTTDEKNIYSHRRKAMDKLLSFISQNGK
jgi:XTP/dITP diphosphohydrolase